MLPDFCSVPLAGSRCFTPRSGMSPDLIYVEAVLYLTMLYTLHRTATMRCTENGSLSLRLVSLTFLIRKFVSALCLTYTYTSLHVVVPVVSLEA